MKKITEKTKREKEKMLVYNNPFDDLFFWLNLASVDFGFFENEKKQKEVQQCHQTRCCPHPRK